MTRCFRLAANDCCTQVSTLFSICLRSSINSRFSVLSAVLSRRRALSSEVMALTLAVSVLMVSAGESASVWACGTASKTEPALHPASRTSRQPAPPSRRQSRQAEVIKRLLVTIDMG